MAYPSGVSTVIITTGTPVGFDWVADITTRVTVTPTMSLVWAATGQPVLDFVMTTSAEEGMPASFEVPHVDQPGFLDSSGNTYTMWAYRVVVTWTDKSSKSTKTMTKNIQPLRGQTGPIDLDLVPGGEITLPVAAPRADVLSVAGLTGVVSAADLAARIGGGGSGGPITSELITDATDTGKLLLTATDPAAAREALDIDPAAGVFGVQRINLTGPTVVSPTAEWPTGQVVSVQLVQPAGAGHAITLGSGAVLAEGAEWLPGESPGDVSMAVFTHTGTRWVCEGCWVSVLGAAAPTPISVTASAPTWTDAAANGGGTWSTPTVTGVTYSPASGTATPGQSVTVTATAQSGYVLSGTSSWTHVFPADTTAPTGGTLTVSGTGNAGTTRTLTVSGATDPRGLHAQPYAFSTDGGTTFSAWQASASFTTAALAAGTYNPRARVRDAATNTATLSAASFTVAAAADTTAPTWSATFTLGTPTTTSVVATASAMAADNVGVTGYEVSYNDGGTWAAITPSGSNFTLAGTAGTTYATTRLRAMDAAGNRSTAVSVPSYTLAADTPPAGGDPVIQYALGEKWDTGSGNSAFPAATLAASATAGRVLVAALALDKAYTAAGVSVLAPDGFTMHSTVYTNAGTTLCLATKVATGGETVVQWGGKTATESLYARCVSGVVETAGTSAKAIAGDCPAAAVTSITVDPGTPAGAVGSIAFASTDSTSNGSGVQWPGTPPAPSFSTGWTLVGAGNVPAGSSSSPNLAIAKRSGAGPCTMTSGMAEEQALAVVVV